MARIRTIKPEFWTHAQVVECSTNARLLFIGLWNFCDDHGRHPLAVKQIKAEIFPADDISLDSIRGMILELSKNGLIGIYSVDNKEFLHVLGWHHQRIDKRQEPKYPGPQEGVPRTFQECSTLEGIKEGKGKEGKNTEEDKSSSGAPAPNGVDGKPPYWPKRDGYKRLQGEPDPKLMFAMGRDMFGDRSGASIVGKLKSALTEYTRRSGADPEITRAGIELLLMAHDAGEPKPYLMKIIHNLEMDEDVHWPSEVHPLTAEPQH